MFPTLGHFINYIFGMDINFPMPTYGFILVLAFLTGGLVLRQAFIFREKRGEFTSLVTKKLVKGPINYFDLIFGIVFYGFVGYKLGGVVTEYSEFAQSVDTYIFSLKGNIWFGLVSLLAAGIYGYRKALVRQAPEKIYEKIVTWPHDLWLNIMVVAAFSGIIGAKLFDVLENLPAFFRDPIDQLFSSGGFTFYGGLIMGIVGVGVYMKRNKISYIKVMDTAAPAILAAYAVGRLACMLSGDGCWGIPNPAPQPEFLAFLPDWMWAYDFPHNVIKEGIQIPSCHGDYCYMLDVPVFPTPFYESALSALFAGMLWYLQRIIRIDGVLFFIMFIMNGIARFFIEKIRVNITYEFGSMHITQAEIISSLMVLGGIIGIIFLYLRARKQ